MKLLGHPLAAARPRCATRTRRSTRCALAAAAMLQAAYGLERPPPGDEAGLDLRAHEAVLKVARELESWEGSADAATEELVAALEQATVRVDRAAEQGRVAVHRPPAGADAPVRGGLRPRARGGRLPAPQRRRRRSCPTRSAAASTTPAATGASRARPARARPLPLLHGVHAPAAAALPRPRGGLRRRPPARGEPVLGRGARLLRSGRGRAVHRAARSSRS